MHKLLKAGIFGLGLVVNTLSCTHKTNQDIRYNPEYLDSLLESKQIEPFRVPREISSLYQSLKEKFNAVPYHKNIFEGYLIIVYIPEDVKKMALEDKLFLDASATFILSKQKGDTLRLATSPDSVEVRAVVYDKDLKEDKELLNEYYKYIENALREAVKKCYATNKSESVKAVLLEYPFFFGNNSIIEEQKRDQ